MKLNLDNLHLTGDDGTHHGHALDHLRNKPEAHADVKAALDIAWQTAEGEWRRKAQEAHARAEDALRNAAAAQDESAKLREELAELKRAPMLPAEVPTIQAIVAKLQPKPPEAPPQA